MAIIMKSSIKITKVFDTWLVSLPLPERPSIGPA